jgi:SAM-dependent methyltransferase
MVRTGDEDVWETDVSSASKPLSADGRRSAAQYDAMAAQYSEVNADSAFNAYYERPAMISLLGDVGGRRVLEVGCGAGPLTEWLVDHGAEVTATDVSPAMAALARQRLGRRAEVVVADVGTGLGFAHDGTFDVVVASLVLHYLRDWDAVFGEVHRVLRPSGRFLFSTHHPTADARLHSPEDYFAIKEVTEEWVEGCAVTFWRRPLTAMGEALAGAGFVITSIVEPPPAGTLETIDPGAYRRLTTQPAFLFFELRPRPESWAEVRSSSPGQGA